MDTHLRDLRYAVAVAEHLNVTAAAEDLGIAQPTLSRQLRVLERQVGFAIFERRHTGVALTPAGEALLERVRPLITEWNDAVAHARSVASPGILRVGLQTAVGRGIIAELAADLDPQEWQLSLRIVPWTDPSAGLADGTSDIAVLWEPVIPNGVTTVAVLRVEARCLILRQNHRLATRESLDVNDIEEEPIIALPREAGPLRDFWIGADGRTEPATIALEAVSADDVFEAVGAGLGVAIVTQKNAELYRRPGIVAVPLTGLSPARLVLGTSRVPSTTARRWLDGLRHWSEPQPPSPSNPRP